MPTIGQCADIWADAGGTDIFAGVNAADVAKVANGACDAGDMDEQRQRYTGRTLW